MRHPSSSQETPVSQFPQPGYYDPNAISTTPRKSGLAVTALVFAVVAFVAFLGVTGLAMAGLPFEQLMLASCCGVCVGVVCGVHAILLGLIGVVAIRPPKSGKGACAIAIVLGIVATTGQLYFG